LVISGFTNGIAQSTPECYAFNVKVAGSVWRKMDDLPIAVGLTHAAVAVVGTKLYMCGGYVFLISSFGGVCRAQFDWHSHRMNNILSLLSSLFVFIITTTVLSAAIPARTFPIALNMTTR
jgi:hypothetical protein